MVNKTKMGREIKKGILKDMWQESADIQKKGYTNEMK